MSMDQFIRTVSKELDSLTAKVDRLERTNEHFYIHAGRSKVSTIDNGIITVTLPNVLLQPETGTTDTLNFINGGIDGKMAVISTEDDGDIITVNPYTLASGNIDLRGSGNGRILSDPHDSIFLIYRAGTEHWEQVSPQWLNSLVGVVLTEPPADGDVLQYDLTSGNWINAPVPAGGFPGLHASTHQHGGSDEVATSTPGANAIPKALGTGLLDGAWLDSEYIQDLLGLTFSGNVETGVAGTYDDTLGKIDLAITDTELLAIAGLVSAADRLPYFTGLGTASLATFTAFARTLLDDADALTMRATLGLVIGTNVQAQDAELQAIAGLTSAADSLPYFTGSGTASLTILTAFARTLLDDADAVTMRTTLGLTDEIIQDLVGLMVIGNTESGIAATYDDTLGKLDFVLDAELLAIAGLVSAADRLPYFTGSGTASLAIFTAFARTLLDDADAATARATLGLSTEELQDFVLATLFGGTELGISVAYNDATNSVDFDAQTAGDIRYGRLAAANIWTNTNEFQDNVEISSDAFLILSDPDVAHGMTVAMLATDNYGIILPMSVTAGGLRAVGASDIDAIAFSAQGIIGVTNPTLPAVNIRADKKSGTGTQALAAGEIALRIDNATTVLATIFGNGDIAMISGSKLWAETIRAVDVSGITFTDDAGVLNAYMEDATGRVGIRKNASLLGSLDVAAESNAASRMTISAELASVTSSHFLSAAFYVPPKTSTGADVRTRTIGLHIPSIDVQATNLLVGNQNAGDSGQIAGIRIDSITSVAANAGDLDWSNYGIWIKSLGGGVGTRHQYGLKIDEVIGAVERNYGIYIAGGIENYIAGLLTLGGALDVAGLANFSAQVEIEDGALFVMSDPDVAHGMILLAPTDVYARFGLLHATLGGLDQWGLSDGDAPGARLIGILGTNTPTVTTPALQLRGDKKSGTGNVALAATETAIGFYNNATLLARFMGNGDLILISGSSLSAETIKAVDVTGLLFQDDGGNPGLTILDGGFVGVGAVTTPQGKLHASGFLIVTKTGIVGVSQTIIPDGTGDILRRVSIRGIVSNSTPASDSININIVPGATSDITIGADVLRFTVSAAGALTVIRQAGAVTWSFTIECIWE